MAVTGVVVFGATALQPSPAQPATCVATGLVPDPDGPFGGGCPDLTRAQRSVLAAEAAAEAVLGQAMDAADAVDGAEADRLLDEVRAAHDRTSEAAATARQAVAADRAAPALMRRLERSAQGALDEARAAALELEQLG